MKRYITYEVIVKVVAYRRKTLAKIYTDRALAAIL